MSPSSASSSPPHRNCLADPTIQLASLDWAIVGNSESAVVNGVSHSKWHHWIDSRTAVADGVVDEGDMSDHPTDPALTLEKGRMLNPATGVETDYEEMWRSEPIEVVPGIGDREGAVTCLALHWDGAVKGDAPEGCVRRGLVVRLGQYCQAFARDGESISLERLKWDAGQQRWASLARMGDQEFPTDIATYFAHEATVDDEVTVGGAIWKVVEQA